MNNSILVPVLVGIGGFTMGYGFELLACILAMLLHWVADKLLALIDKDY